VFALSTQTSEYQQEMARRLQLPFEILTDAEFKLCDQLHFPTFEVDGMRLLKRLTMVVRGGRIEHVFYPVFPPNESAEQVLRWLRKHRSLPAAPRRQAEVPSHGVQNYGGSSASVSP